MADDPRVCTRCGAESGDGRFCRSCGALLPTADVEPASVEDAAAVEDTAAIMDDARDADVAQVVPGRPSRRELLIGAGGALVGGLLVAALGTRRTGPDPGVVVAEGDLPALPRYDVGAVDDIVAGIEADGVHWIGEARRAVVVAWDPSLPYRDGTAIDAYGPSVDGRARGTYDDEPVVRDDLGLLVLRPVAGNGCRAERCDASGWFEDPCHGTLFNGWGEWVGGPPQGTGLPRHRAWIVDGRLLISPSTVPGRAVADNVLGDDGRGPGCVTF